jgi:exodeoxyribonuclease VII large subunit
VSQPAESAAPVFAVGDLLAGLRSLLEDRVGRVWVVGEVSNLRRAASGHVYFTLKDERGQIRAALFRASAQRLVFEPEDGLEVLAYGEITVYEARGDLQLIVRQLEPRGEGALRVAFEQLRRRLEAEGLFDAARKRGLPALPRRLGVVASAESAALRDVLEVTGRRWPALPLCIATSRVQGAGAEHEVAAALDALAAQGGVDAILLVRGGGSLEDLWAFNTETLARAIARCPVPVVCGVGHEIDVTIADLVADLRAPTPSAAAELAVPDRSALARALASEGQRLRQAVRAVLAQVGARLAHRREALARHAPTARLAAWRARLEALSRALPLAARARLSAGRAALGEAAGRLESLSPLAVLGRGYALVRRARDGAILRRADQLAPGERLAVRLAEAELEAELRAVRALPAPGKLL